MIVSTVLSVLIAYCALGILFALPFVLFGVQRIDESARNASIGFRLIILPGTVALWPYLLFRWLKSRAR